MMKPFDYYSKVAAEYPDRNKYRKELEEAIDNAPMTAAERAKVKAEIPSKVRLWFLKAAEPYREAEKKLESEFWTDCQEELGYGKYLNADGITALESYAWEEGHAYGHSEVYSHLLGLADLAEKLVRNRK